MRETQNHWQATNAGADEKSPQQIVNQRFALIEKRAPRCVDAHSEHRQMTQLSQRHF